LVSVAQTPGQALEPKQEIAALCISAAAGVSSASAAACANASSCWRPASARVLTLELGLDPGAAPPGLANPAAPKASSASPPVRVPDRHSHSRSSALIRVV